MQILCHWAEVTVLRARWQVHVAGSYWEQTAGSEEQLIDTWSASGNSAGVQGETPTHPMGNKVAIAVEARRIKER